jgi:hypothetical protein
MLQHYAILRNLLRPFTIIQKQFSDNLKSQDGHMCMHQIALYHYNFSLPTGFRHCCQVPLSMRHNKISTVQVGTSVVHTVKQGTQNLVMVSVINFYFNNVAVTLDRTMNTS